MAEKIIELDNISVTFKQKDKTIEAVKNVSLNINKGDIYGIVGYSGAGKSTLVRVINLLQQPSSGRAKINGDLFYEKIDGNEKVIPLKKLREKRRKIGMIFQHFNLLNEQTVVQNVAFALKHSSLKEKEIKAKALDLLKLVGLEERADAYPSQLSGGQQQRVAIARALANDPEILISDEGTSALDPKNTVQILDLLKRLNKELGLTVVLITHEMEAVKRIADRVAVMENGEVIETGGLLDIFTNAKHHLTREFVGTESGSAKALATLQAANLVELDDDQECIQLTYIGAAVSESLIVKLYKDFDIVANIIYGNIEILQGTPVGALFVIIKGSAENRERATAFLKKQDIIINKVEEGELVNG
ncbi:methionine ABC transporter [Liquorilactobacillus sucicola DSM 21376 = JCM 15457]|uniref:ABC transporter, ATP-binding protein n=1 Tax=Liquorilactobacillus sucicola DSM 21376 = JCM 15457 TaxID=1423806 RepID=A0A023CY26_9LACO|nr:methionine ABC transporter ATP-binding protein [Liquorilactobacillus sucicola]KRN06944.1 ABC transporter, ATP-binding protein [Liquorilactobacillus sucicola DSM 21376 = JCM 15457]GAJ26425.1 methionine ABC transporter [Liquorilactobacillus sucicola DSM 21376 = JCM 15457]